ADEEPESQEGRSFWREDALHRPAPPRLLFGRAAATHTAGRRILALDLRGSALDELREAATNAGASTPTFLEAVWHALLARLSGAGELLIAGWFDGRSQPDLERALGPYEQPAPIRSRCERDTSFAEILDQVRRARSRT